MGRPGVWVVRDAPRGAGRRSLCLPPLVAAKVPGQVPVEAPPPSTALEVVSAVDALFSTCLADLAKGDGTPRLGHHQCQGQGDWDEV